MSIKKPEQGDMVRVEYDDDGETGEVIGEVTSKCGVEGDFGIRVESAELVKPVFARTYASNVYSFDGNRRDVFGELQAIEVVE